MRNIFLENHDQQNKNLALGKNLVFGKNLAFGKNLDFTSFKIKTTR